MSVPRAGVCALLAVLLGFGGAAQGANPTCAWPLKVADSSFNIGWPDTNSVYYVTRWDGWDETLSFTMTGTYFNARFFSMNMYDAAGLAYNYTTAGGVTVKSNMTDYLVAPDAGSRNPWATRRAAPGGSWTLRIVNDPTGAPNELPLRVNGGQPSSGFFFLRVYLPTGGADNVNLPTITRTQGGVSTTLPLCDTPAVPAELTAAWNALVQQMIAQQTAADAAACVEAGTGASCRNNTDFGAWARWGGATSDTTSTFFNNLSGYLFTMVKPTDDVFVTVLKPTPHSPPGTTPAKWPNNDAYNLRYWSICSNIMATPLPTVINTDPVTGRKTYGCMSNDVAVPERDGSTIIVVTRPSLRPSNARNWLPFSTSSPLAQHILLFRNMLCSSNYAACVRNVPYGSSAQTARQVMGKYYPISFWCSRRAWNKGGRKTRDAAEECYEEAKKRGQVYAKLDY